VATATQAPIANTTNPNKQTSPNTTKQPIINIHTLHKSFNGFHILKKINLQITKNTTTIILNNSNSNKTILIKHIINLFKPNNNKIIINNKNISTISHQNLSIFHQHINIIFQNTTLFNSITINNNISFPLHKHTKLNKPKITKKIKKTLTIINLINIKKKFPTKLSNNIHKHINLTHTIIHNPKIILYNKPTTNLNPLTTKNINQIIISTT